MKVSFHMPTHARKAIKPAYLFLQNGLRCFLLDQHRDKELWVADDPGSKLDFDRALAIARRACRGQGLVDGAVHYLQCDSPGVAPKRNLMAQKADADVFVQHDDDDLYPADYGTIVADWLDAHPQCPGNLRWTLRTVYVIPQRRYGVRTGAGSATHAIRSAVWHEHGLKYPKRFGASDTAMVRGLARTQPALWQAAIIPPLSGRLIVIRLRRGHISSNVFGRSVRRLKDVRGDPGGKWLLGHVPRSLAKHYRQLLKNYAA